MSAAINAMRVLTAPVETGAVTLCLPQDVQGVAWDYPDDFFAKRVHRFERFAPTEAMLQDALRMIAQKKRPLLICGGGVKYSAAEQALVQFAERFAIPFAETQAGKGAIPSDHKLNLGGIGETGSLSANTLAQQADLIIGVGTRYTDFTTASKWLFQNPDVNFININPSGFDAEKLDGIRVQADARVALTLLETHLHNSGYRSAWGDAIAEARKRYLTEVERVYGVEYTGEDFIPEIADKLDRVNVYREFQQITRSILTQTRVLGVLNQTLPHDAIIVAAAGSLPGDLQRVWQSKGNNDYHVEYGYSCMGYEVNAALGAKIAQPEREVYAFVGDGSFMMLHSELVTSVQMGKKINVILLDNMTNGCINNLQLEHGMGSFFTEFRFHAQDSARQEGGLIPIDFAKIAAGYGCKSYHVTDIDQLHSALEDAGKQTVSTLIDIKVLPKTMVHGYLNWWRVGVASVAKNEDIQLDAIKHQQNIDRARQY